MTPEKEAKFKNAARVQRLIEELQFRSRKLTVKDLDKLEKISTKISALERLK